MNKKMSLGGICFVMYEKPEAGEAVLCIHGHGGDHRGLQPLAKALNATAYSIDLPGFGESKLLKEHTMPALAQSIKELATELGLSHYTVLGHSLGSSVALELAANDSRVNKLILVNPIPAYNKIMKKVIKVVGDVSQKIPEPYAQKLIHARLYNLGTFLINSRRRRDHETRLAYLKQQSETKYSLKAWHEAGTASYYYDQIETARRISCPTLLLHGELDSLTTDAAINEFQHDFKKGALVVIPKAGHFMHAERTSEVAEAINNFIKADK